MQLELNNYGFFNLTKTIPVASFEAARNSFRTTITADVLSQFLSMNELFLNENKEITDGVNVYGVVSLLC